MPLLFSPDGSRILSPGGGLKLIDAATGEILGDQIMSAMNGAFLPDGRVELAVDWPGNVLLFHADDLTAIKTPRPSGGAANEGGHPNQGSPALALSRQRVRRGVALAQWCRGVERRVG